MRYRREFGEGNLYTLLSREEGEKAQDKPEAGYIAFSRELTYQHLAEWISLGAEMHETRLSENFDFDAYYEKYFDKGILLFAIDPRGRLRVIVEDKELEFGPGWTLLSLVRAEDKAESESA